MARKFHYNKNKFKLALQAAGIRKGDRVFGHFATLKLGFPEELAQGVSAFDVIYQAIMEVIGEEGTFLTPTYTYSLCKGEIFDPDTTPSSVGPFGETFRQLKGVKRSLDPIFSVSGIGPAVDDLFHDLPHDCFGEDCLFDRLGKAGVKLCNIGLDLYWTTSVHCVEQSENVNHRYLKYFTGNIKINNEVVKQTWKFYVSFIADFSQPEFHRIEDEAVQAGVCKIEKVGLGQITTIKFSQLYDLCRVKIQQNPWYFATGPVYNKQQLTKYEEGRYGKKNYQLNVNENTPLIDLIQSIQAIPRYLLSDGYDAVLTILSNYFEMTLLDYPSGAYVGDCIIPERWIFNDISLKIVSGKNNEWVDDKHFNVMSHSLPFSGEVSRDDLLKHCYSDTPLTDFIPFKHLYHERDWGICCDQAFFHNLKHDLYEVNIDTVFTFGRLKMGEMIVQGKIDDCVLLGVNLSYSENFSDDLSGLFVAIKIMQKIMLKNDLFYTVRLIIFPDIMGLAAYLQYNQSYLSKVKGLLLIESFVTDSAYLLKNIGLKHSKFTSQVENCFKENNVDFLFKTASIAPKVYKMLEPFIHSLPLLSLSRQTCSETKLNKNTLGSEEVLTQSFEQVLKIIYGIKT
jgi:aminopeptidase-like protein/aminoglycoside N3'-acetyltransferase